MYQEPLGWLKAWHPAVAVQYFLIAINLLVPFGFDHPSSWGLDFNHQVIALLMLAFASLVAVVTAIMEKSLAGLLFSVVIPALIFWILTSIGT